MSIWDDSVDSEERESVSSFVVEDSGDEYGNDKAVICATSEGGRGTATYEVGSSRSSCM